MSSPHRFVVRRQVYTPADGNGVRRLLPEKHERVATFPKADAAFADCATRLAEFRRTTNPFQLGGPCLFYQTNLPAFAFHDYLLDHNITPPPTTLTANPNYVFWWVRNNRTFTDRERDVVWTACDKLKPFDVIEEDDRKAVFVVVEVPWYASYHALGHDTFCTEGGHPITAFTQIRDARRVCDSLTEKKQNEASEFSGACVRGAQVLIAEDGDPIPFAEIATIQVSPEPTRSAYLVCRQSFRSENGGYDLRDGLNEQVVQDCPCWNLGGRVPVAGFSCGTDAVGIHLAFVEKCRRRVNPFALTWPNGFEEGALLDTHGQDRLLPNDLTIDDAIEIIRKLPTIPPAPEVLSAEWYDRVVQWSPEFVDVIWATFADFRLFEVIEVPLG